MTEIHAHEIMHMMLEHGDGFSRDSLANAIVERFGPEARFYSCSQSDMDVQGVIDFLESRGKFVPSEGGFNTAKEKICSH